jgi:hypothetical protein
MLDIFVDLKNHLESVLPQHKSKRHIIAQLYHPTKPIVSELSQRKDIQLLTTSLMGTGLVRRFLKANYIPSPYFHFKCRNTWKQINSNFLENKHARLILEENLDLTQQAYSFYYRNKNWFYHVNFGRLGIALNTGASVTRAWDSKKYKEVMFGTQLGVAVVANGDKSNTDAYFVMVPYTSFILQKKVQLTKNIDWSPQTYITLCSPYYDLGANFASTSNTFNMVTGNNFTFNISKRFKLSLSHRANINTTPNWGVMHNLLIGSSLKF